MDYIIRKSISYLEKTSRLCNPEANNTSEKKISDYIIRKLILCIEKTSRLCNPEANHKKTFGLYNSEANSEDF